MSYSIFVKDGTAQGVAKQRLIETIAGPEKSVINDPYADKFVIGSGVIKLMGHRLNVWLTSKLAPGFHEHLISRTRFIDDLIEKSAKEGVQQYVILGAGYDSRANRLNLPPSLKIFEVDQPEVSDIKLSKLPKDLPNLENITYVNVDFSYQSLSEQLLTAGFDKTKSTIFTLEGVSQYITKEAVSSTIQELSLITKDARSIFFKILNLGFYDALRLKTSNGNIYTQWDYQAGAWQQNEGVRIDHFLLNPLATDKLISFGIDKYMRTLDRPSDHVPIWITMSS